MITFLRKSSCDRLRSKPQAQRSWRAAPTGFSSGRCRCFNRLGYHQTTTNVIATEAGVSPATLYQFFPNKEAIASALASMYAREMAEQNGLLTPKACWASQKPSVN